jgi:hypothetical protein
MDRLAPSAYHDPREVLWKHIVAQTYWDILGILGADAIAPGDLDQIRLPFLRAFNSHHDIDVLCAHGEAAAARLAADLGERGRAQAAAAVAGQIDGARESLRVAMASLPSLRQVDRAQSYVADGLILIAGKRADEFAANPDFVRASLELVGEDTPQVAAEARAAWRRGFLADRDLAHRVRTAAEEGCGADDMLAEVLIREQRSGAYPSLRDYEFRTDRSQQENRQAKLLAIGEGYYLLGRLMSCIALFNEGAAPIAAAELDEACPVAATLRQAGIAVTPAQLDAFRQFTLVRCTHGLNPGEFTARIASSVRTTFPQALLASLMVRAGKVHGGALTECMRQLDGVLAAPSRQAFARGLLDGGDLYGFGHRIHKPDPGAGEGAPGGDPRVAFQMAGAPGVSRAGGTDPCVRAVRDDGRRDEADARAQYRFRGRRLVPLPRARPPGGLGRLHHEPVAGPDRQVINQLDYKANALRPPLAVNLPYTV